MIFCWAAIVLNGAAIAILTNLSGAKGLNSDSESGMSDLNRTVAFQFATLPWNDGVKLAGSAVHEAANFGSALCREAFSCFWPSTDRHKTTSVVKGCSCHDYCRLFGDCCLDKEQSPTAVRSQRLPRGSYECASQRSFTHTVYVVTSCPAEYASSLVIDACSNGTREGTATAEDRSTPVTDRVTGVTYRNRYCATCWEIPERRLTTWLWRFSCGHLSGDEGALPHAATTTGPPSPSVESDRRRAVLDYVRNQCTLKYSPPPELNGTLHSCLRYLVDRCPELDGGDDEKRKRCVTGPAEYTYSAISKVYRNRDCASCNAPRVVSTDDPPAPKPLLKCQPTRIERVLPMLSFAVLLTPDGGGGSTRGRGSGGGRCVAVEGRPTSSGDWTAAELCRDNGVFRHQSAAPVCTAGYGGSRCLSGEAERSSACTHFAYGGDTAAYTLVAASGSGTALESSFVRDTLVVRLNDSATLCVVCSVEHYINYTLHDDGSLSVSVDEANALRRFVPPFYSFAAAAVTVCLPPARGNGSASAGDDAVAESSRPSGCSYVPAAASAAAVVLSLVGLVLFAVAFASLKYMRRYPGDLVMNQATAFFVAFALFLARPLAVGSPRACAALAIAVHYFFVSAFAWTTLYAMAIARALSFRMPTSGPSRLRQAARYLLGWAGPLLCVALGVAADERDLPFAPSYGGPQCFIGGRLGHLVLFMAPLCVCLGVDVAVYVYMIVKLAVIARQTVSVRSSHNEKLWLCIRLVFSTGLVWIVAVMASFTGSEALLCAFSLLNALQGMFLFVVFVCKRETIASLRQRHVKDRESRRISNIQPATQVSAVAL